MAENLDVMVLRQLRDWRCAGRRALLATVVRTWGSSPRPVGSILALAEDGTMIGSVSGGCIEDDLIASYSSVGESGMPRGAPRLIRYGVSADEAHRFGLPCGGTLELLLEFEPEASAIADLVRLLEAGSLVHRQVALSEGGVTLTPAQAPAELFINAGEMVNTFGPEYRMLLIGAGQIAEYLATMAQFSGFAVTLCDPRAEYLAGWKLAGVAVTKEMPDDAVIAFRADQRSCIIALSHDPKLDDLALLEALETSAFYVGAIGSRRNTQARRERLVTHFGHSPTSIARLRGPIGLYIGSKTPPEIAVSVMAEVLATKNAVTCSAIMGVADGKALMESSDWSDSGMATTAHLPQIESAWVAG